MGSVPSWGTVNKILHALHSMVSKKIYIRIYIYIHTRTHTYGEGNGNPLQCSCLENPRDGGALWADVYGVTQSWTRLKWLSSSSTHTYIYVERGERQRDTEKGAEIKNTSVQFKQCYMILSIRDAWVPSWHGSWVLPKYLIQVNTRWKPLSFMAKSQKSYSLISAISCKL